MNVNADRIQAYIDKKGLKPVADDSQWKRFLSELKDHLGTEIPFRVKTIIQQEDSLRRYCTRFPEQIPTPYRFIDWIEFGAYLPEDKNEIEEIKRMADSNGVLFELVDHRFWVDDDQRDGWIIRIRGYNESKVQQVASRNPDKPVS